MLICHFRDFPIYLSISGEYYTGDKSPRFINALDLFNYILNVEDYFQTILKHCLEIPE